MEKAENKSSEKKEGEVAKAIENQTPKLPSDVFLWSAIGAMTVSLGLKLCKRNHTALSLGNGLHLFFCLECMIKLSKQWDQRGMTDKVILLFHFGASHATGGESQPYQSFTYI